MRETITFWYGCNVLRHGDIIHTCLDILRALGFDARPAGGPDYCCGSAKDANQTAADGMAHRTVHKFNERGRGRVVAWCPSCHSHMTDFMSQAYPPEFDLTYFVDLLYEHRAALARQFTHAVPMRVIVHRHLGFNDYAPVNDKVPELLRLVPGVEVIEDSYLAPGYMCASLAAVPAAMTDMVRNTLVAAARTRADAVVTIFHQCYRELCGLEAQANVQVYNYIHLFARSMGLPYVDEYKQWKKLGPGAGAAIGEKRLARIGVQFFERAILPEIVKRAPGLDAENGSGSAGPGRTEP